AGLMKFSHMPLKASPKVPRIIFQPSNEGLIIPFQTWAIRSPIQPRTGETIFDHNQFRTPPKSEMACWKACQIIWTVGHHSWNLAPIQPRTGETTLDQSQFSLSPTQPRALTKPSQIGLMYSQAAETAVLIADHTVSQMRRPVSVLVKTSYSAATRAIMPTMIAPIGLAAIAVFHNHCAAVAIRVALVYANITVL